MKKNWILARSMILKNIYSSIVYVILSMILAFLCNTIFSLEDNFNTLFSAAFKDTNSADCAEVIPTDYYNIKKYYIRKMLNEDTDVSNYQVEDALLLLNTQLIHENQETRLSGAWMIRNINRDTNLSTTKILEESQEKYEDPIYIPFICKSFFRFKLGDRLAFKHNNKTATYHIAGFTESILFGNRGTIAFELPDKAFKAMNEDFVEKNENSKIILIKSQNLSIHKKLLSLFKDVPYLNYVDRINAAFTMNASMKVYKYIMIFFAVINIIVVALIIKYKTQSSIINGYKNIGILKAIGYRSDEISITYVIQYIFLSSLGYITGIILSAKLYNSIFKSITAETGFQWKNNINLIIIICFFIISICTIAILTFLSVIKTGKVSPVKALHGILDDVLHISKISSTKGVLYPNFIIAWKLFCKRKKQNTVLIIIISLSVLAASFCLTLYSNIVENKKLGLKQISGMENFSIILQLTDAADIEQSVKKIKDINDVKQVVKAIGPGGSVLFCDDKINARTTVYDDYEKIEKVGLYKGRYPIHENEVAISAALSDMLKKTEGDFITIKNELQENCNIGEYIITGIIQGSYTGGIDIALTFDGIRQIDKNAGWQTVYVYTPEEKNIDKVIEDIKQVCDKDITYIDNFQNIFNKQFESVTENISNLIILVLLLSICIISVIIFLVAQTTLLSNTYMFGILKAIGFKTIQIIYQAMASMLPIVIFGSLGGYILSKFFTDILITLMLNKMGVYKVNFLSPDVYISGFVFLLCIVSSIVSVLTLWKLKSETPISVIKRKE